MELLAAAGGTASPSRQHCLHEAAFDMRMQFELFVSLCFFDAVRVMQGGEAPG